MSCVFDSVSSIIIVLETCSHSTRLVLLKDVGFLKLFHSVVKEISINFLENYKYLPFNLPARNSLMKERSTLTWLSKDLSRKEFQNFVIKKKNTEKLLHLLKLGNILNY